MSYGKLVVLSNINLSIEKGQIYCLLGKNGVGKTTLINLILDLIKPSEGTIKILGFKSNMLDKSMKKKLGAVNDSLALIEELTGYEFLYFVGKIYGLPTDTLKKRIFDIFSYFFEDESDLYKNISKYSTGMKKKLAFCSSVIHTPEILILDEPFSGLDPLVADQMICFINKYQNKDRVILMSSHDLSYVEKVATHIAVLDKKKIIFNSTLQDFTENGEKKIDSALLKFLRPNNSAIEKFDWI